MTEEEWEEAVAYIENSPCIGVGNGPTVKTIHVVLAKMLQDIHKTVKTIWEFQE